MRLISLLFPQKEALLIRFVVTAAIFCGITGLGTLIPAKTHANTMLDQGVYPLVAPALPDGPSGWSRSPVVIRLVPLGPGVVYYAWNDVFGVWRRADGPILAPEGKRVLYFRLVTAFGVASETQSIVTRVDYQAHRPLVQTQDQAAYTAGVTVRVTVNPIAGVRQTRLGGSDRFETAALISEYNFESADTVIIATGMEFADALAASGLAGCVEGPVLLTRPGSLPVVASEEIIRLRARNAIIVGGESAVQHGVRQQLEALGLNVTRIGGADRYETAILIAAKVVQFGHHGGRVFVARGDLFADAVALGPLAYAARAPVILVQPTVMPSVVRSFLVFNSLSSGLVAGGEKAVSPTVFQELHTWIPGLVRAGGDTRYNTAVAVAAWGVVNGLASYSVVGVATGADFADALTGGTAIGASRGVIFLTTPQTLSPASGVAIAAVARDILTLQVFGGPAAISNGVFSDISEIVR